uniref:Uncharacterized protein n=1 Tax=Sus scrofa TaxID=9823 RepID=A0A8D1F3J4_PIG
MRRRGSRGRRPTSVSTGRWATRPSRSSTPPRGRTSWAAPLACVSTRCTLAGCVCTARSPPTCYAPRSLSPTCTTSPSWRLRSTRPPRPACSEPSSRPGWAPGWRSPPSRTSSHSHPDRRARGPGPHTQTGGRCGMGGAAGVRHGPRNLTPEPGAGTPFGEGAGGRGPSQGPGSPPGLSLQPHLPF